MQDRFKYEDVHGYRFPTSFFGRSRAYSYIYFVDGLLIDTGHSKKQASITSTIGKLPVQSIFITHHHEDHTGNLYALTELFKCEVLASEECSELMKAPPKLTLAQKLYWGNRSSYHLLSPVSDFISTVKYRFEIIPIPGHADDMVALYEPNKGWLFSADLYINTRIGYFLREESIKSQMESIRKIVNLDFEVMFCSHNPELEDGKEKLIGKLNYLEDFSNTIIELHHQGNTIKEIFKKLDLQEFKLIKFLSGGQLSKENMVRSVLRDFC